MASWGRRLSPVVFGMVAGSSMTYAYNNIYKAHKTWDWDWDGRHESFLKFIDSDPPFVPSGYRAITLVRHSQYNRVQGEVNDEKTLTELGIKQAQLTGQRLKIYTSSFVRAQQTAHLVVDELEQNDVSEIIVDPDIAEGIATIMEPYVNMKTKEQILDEISRFGPRIRNGFRRYFHRRDAQDMDLRSEREAEEILLVGHGNCFRYYLARCLQFDETGWARFGMHNCAISRIYIYDDGRVRMDHLGDTGHLPPDMLTANYRKCVM